MSQITHRSGCSLWLFISTSRINSCIRLQSAVQQTSESVRNIVSVSIFSDINWYCLSCLHWLLTHSQLQTVRSLSHMQNQNQNQLLKTALTSLAHWLQSMCSHRGCSSSCSGSSSDKLSAIIRYKKSSHFPCNWRWLTSVIRFWAGKKERGADISCTIWCSQSMSMPSW